MAVTEVLFSWLSRDNALFFHIIIGGLLVVLPLIILLYLGKKPSWLKNASLLAALASWLVFVPAARLYVDFYPATKTLILAGTWPWAHKVVMETKEHWGLLLPVIATVAAWQVFKGDEEKSRKWWALTLVLALLLAVMGRLVKMGAGAQ
ncbi:MAG TPA: hypothetical protein VJA40_01415 [archaeon]|nr:hypothetical protein [archaeon]